MSYFSSNVSTATTSSRMQSTSLRLSNESLDQVRDRLLAFQEEKMEANEDTKPIIIRENVSIETYIKYWEVERKLPVSIRLVEGKIIAYEVPLTSHGIVAGEIAFLIRSWNNQLYNAQKEDLIVGPNSYYTADLTIRPRGLPRPPPDQGPNSEGRPYPTLVVEVGNSESVPSLHDLSTGFFSPRTTIRIYLAIKMFPIRQDGTRAMLALRYLRTNQINTVPDIIISFGTAPLHNNTIRFLANIGVPLDNIVGVGFSETTCNASGISIYQLHIPAIELFKDAFGGIPAGAVNGFCLDLWELQNIVLNDF
ncbi:12386_t:CDS:1 [Acaulospora morrowiae]|uniref:12386_t:CDS:1 n=1 Tax=Acaulospora morrowiae TaxID=94023 RepID=A0A9N9GA03_9GLOM|nr:12386_t:CDS:1 [Acaulospora morrowiae]